MRNDLLLSAALLAPFLFSLVPPPEKDLPGLPEVRVKAAKGAVTIDGRLDETAWRGAAVLSLRRADGQAAASPPTEVRVLHDGKSLYVAFISQDSDIWTAHRGRDSHMWTEDVVEVFIDVDPADPAYVELEVNPQGDLFDGMFFRHRSQVLMSWNPSIAVAVSADGTVNRQGDSDRSWTVEMAVPVGELAPALGVGRPGVEIRPGSAFGINFYRHERSGDRSELQAWAPVRGDFHAPALFGRLIFEG